MDHYNCQNCEKEKGKVLANFEVNFQNHSKFKPT